LFDSNLLSLGEGDLTMPNKSGRAMSGGLAGRSLSMLTAALALALMAPAARAQIETAARAAIVIDVTGDTVLLEKNADMAIEPASMSKLMTIYMVFDRMKQGKLSLDDTLPVSERAWRMGGSKMFVDINSRIRVEDLLRGIIIQSGNDACIVFAEALSGSEEAFAEEATKKAREIGLTSSVFRNSSGWPHPEHRMTARDLATLALRTIQDFPEYYHYYSERNFVFNKITQGNRNPLLYKNLGADGLKTGHTDAAGYGLTGAAVRDGRRIILVVSGLAGMRERAQESERLLDWAYREFSMTSLFKAGDQVDKMPVWYGVEKSVPLTVANDLAMTMPRAGRKDLKVTVAYDGPVEAPVQKGTQIATLTISSPGLPERKVPLVAGDDVPRLGLFGRIAATLSHLIFGS
jgi:serine-type D-Ala-D-Ala carboxypeptidase (penicillin-binding protein 5/6)